MEFIAVDVGRDSVKVASKGKLLKFKSKVGEWRPRKLINEDKFEVEIDGHKYFIADLAEESYYEREMMTESKIHPETKVLFLSALALVSVPNEYKVVTGLPIYQHNDEYKQCFNEFLKGSYSVSINGGTACITLGEVWIVPEGAAVVWDMVLDDNCRLVSSPLLSNKVRIVDIGSRTINYCTVDKLKYIDKESGTLNYGCIVLQGASEDQLEDFTRKLIGDLSKVWLNMKATEPVVFAGGGAILLRHYLKKHFQLIYFGDEYSNVRGYLKMGRLRWLKEREK